MQSNNPSWECTFHYVLSEKIPSKNVRNGLDIKFVKDSNDVIEGFSIVVTSSDPDEAEKISKKKASNLESILTIKSGMTVHADLSGLECEDKITGSGHVAKTLQVVYGIKGGLDKLDLTDSAIQKSINSFPNPNLGYLSRAVHHMYEGRAGESIKEAFKIIERNSSFKDYYKYKCIRDVLSHTEQQKFTPGTVNNFNMYFGPTAFDFRRYNPTKGEIVIDPESVKTNRTLLTLARDLVKESRTILNL